MNNTEFVQKLKHRLSRPLPGAAAHDRMKAHRSSGQEIIFKHQGPPRDGGVALLLYRDQGQWCFPLMKRREYPGVHSGQISLPGGKMEPGDANLVDTAVRETQEELGFRVDSGQVIGNLSELYIIASHFNILPAVGILDQKPVIRQDNREVEYTIIAELPKLLAPGSRKEKDIIVRGFDIRAPYFEVDSHIVWGATAMIISEFLSVVKEIGYE